MPVGTYKMRSLSEHVELCEKAIGKRLPKGSRVHHVNGIWRDNRPENLVLCPNEFYHQLLHKRTRALDGCGNTNWRPCKYCKKFDDPLTMKLTTNKQYIHTNCKTKERNAYRARKAAENNASSPG